MMTPCAGHRLCREFLPEALFLAAEQSSIHVLKNVLMLPGSLGAVNGEVRDRYGRVATPLIAAIDRAQPFAVDLFCGARADANRAAGHTGGTPLIWAAMANNAGALDRLLEKRAELSSARNDGVTALYFTAQENSVEALALLLAARAEVGRANNNGATPLYIAAEKNSTELQRMQPGITLGRAVSECGKWPGAKAFSKPTIKILWTVIFSALYYSSILFEILGAVTPNLSVVGGALFCGFAVLTGLVRYDVRQRFNMAISSHSRVMAFEFIANWNTNVCCQTNSKFAVRAIICTAN